MKFNGMKHNDVYLNYNLDEISLLRSLNIFPSLRKGTKGWASDTPPKSYTTGK